MKKTLKLFMSVLMTFMLIFVYSFGNLVYANGTKIEESDRIKYELILGFRKLKGINKYDFKKKFNINIYEVPNIKDMLDKGMLEENNEYIYIPSSWIYKSNEILVRLV